MNLLNNATVFLAVIQQGGFSRAAKFLDVSTGLVSRSITQLEQQLGVSLLKRTTRQLKLTPEGELFFRHARRMQQELDAALSLIQASSGKPKGVIRISAPPYFGRHYLTPILTKFLHNFEDITINLILSNQKLDLIKEELDLVIRGAGYLADKHLKDSSMQMRTLLQEKIKLYASEEYLLNHGEPKNINELSKHQIIGYTEHKKFAEVKWQYKEKNKTAYLQLKSRFNCNDIESGLLACASGFGVGKFTDLNVYLMSQQYKLRPILTQYEWGHYYLYGIFSRQQTLPKRTRLLLEFINAHLRTLLEQGNVRNEKLNRPFY